MATTPETRTSDEVEEAIDDLHDVVEKQAAVIDSINANQKTAIRITFFAAFFTAVIALSTVINLFIALGIF